MARAKGRAAVELEGGPQLRRAFRRFDDRLGDLKATHRRAAETVGDRADTLVPVVSGDLKGSRRIEVRQTGSSVTYGTGIEPYAGPVHFGWRAHDIEPDRWLYDALDETRGEVADRYREDVAGMVRKLDAEAPK